MNGRPEQEPVTPPIPKPYSTLNSPALSTLLTATFALPGSDKEQPTIVIGHTGLYQAAAMKPTSYGRCHGTE